MAKALLENVCSYISSPKEEVECIKNRCAQYVQLMGADPQTGEQIGKWGCAHAFLPMLIIESAQMSRQTGAAVESLRNTVVGMNDLSKGLEPLLKRKRLTI